MTHGSLFSGIGGFDLAAQWMGWENIFHCEINPFGRKILNYYWPKSISYEDITKTDFSVHNGRIDILTGGFPCQPYSLAGKRKGKEDERHLWPEMLRAIKQIQPRWIVGENVFGIINWNGGLVFHEVQTDLEAEGYEVQPFILPACAVNAPHRRDRVWFIAHSQSQRMYREKGNFCEEDGRPIGGLLSIVNESSCRPSEERIISNPFNQGLQRSTRERSSGTERRPDGYAPKFTCQRIATNANSSGHQRRADLPSWKIPTNRSDWSLFPTQSPVCNGDDGISSQLDGITFSKWRNESIKAGGNAVVPQVVFEIFKSIELYETNQTTTTPGCAT